MQSEIPSPRTILPLAPGRRRFLLAGMAGVTAAVVLKPRPRPRELPLQAADLYQPHTLAG